MDVTSYQKLAALMVQWIPTEIVIVKLVAKILSSEKLCWPAILKNLHSRLVYLRESAVYFGTPRISGERVYVELYIFMEN